MMGLRSSGGWRALAVTAALGAGACGPSLLVLVGEGDSNAMAVKAQGTCEGGLLKVQLDAQSRSAEPLGVDLDAVVLREASGRTTAVLGRLADFREGGRPLRKRVPIGAVTVEPRGRVKAAVEFVASCGPAGPVLTIPSVFRLGIGGHRTLPRLDVPLIVDPRASDRAERNAADAPFRN